MTPRLSQHARQRCKEMGISTRLVKRIVQNADVSFPATPSSDGRPTQMLTWSKEERYRVVLSDDNVVLTVLFRCTETYVRKGETYEVVSP